MIFFSNTALAQLVTPSWVDSIPGHYGFGNEVIIGSDGFVYSAGCISLNQAYQRRIALIKIDKSGNRIWLFQSDTLVSSGLNGEANALAMSTDGFIYVVGSRAQNVGATEDLWVGKIDTSGTLVWERWYSYLLPQNNFDVANDVVVDDSGYVYVTGTRNNINNFREIVTLKFDSSGNLLWSKFDYVNNTSASMGANEIKVDDLGNVYVAGTEGYFISPGAKTRALLISYDAAGNQRFRKAYNPVNNYSSDARSVEIDANYNAYISGKASDNSAYIIKYDSSGNQRWIYNYPGAYADDLELSENNTLYMSGCWWDTLHNGRCDMLLAKVDTAGSVLWTTTTGGMNYSWDYGLNVLTDANDNVYLSGVYADSTTINGLATLKYSSGGNLIWLGGFSENTCFGLNSSLGTALDDSGNVFVTSSYCNQGSTEYFFTLKYGSQTTGFQKYDQSEISIFPNPSDGNFIIQYFPFEVKSISIRIVDLFGRERNFLRMNENLEIQNNLLLVSIPQLENGLYTADMIYEGEHHFKQFVILK